MISFKIFFERDDSLAVALKSSNSLSDFMRTLEGKSIKEILDRNQLLKQLIQKFGISGTRKFLKDTGNGNGKLDSICACEN